MVVHFQPLTIFTKCSILNVRLGSEYASGNTYAFIRESSFTSQEKREGVLWLHRAVCNCRKPDLGVLTQEASASAIKNTEIVFEPCCAWYRVPSAI